MTDADGEATETTIWLDIALASKYLDNETHTKLLTTYVEIGKMLNSMAENPEKFLPKGAENAVQK
jgi:four helix bundle protein